MDIIRKRRDALIAKAKGPGERNLEAGEFQEPVILDVTRTQDDTTAPMGRCHGCGIGVTTGWRKGPDGPRSLCGTCGVSRNNRMSDILLTILTCMQLHYEKISRARRASVDGDDVIWASPYSHSRSGSVNQRKGGLSTLKQMPRVVRGGMRHLL